MMSHSKDSNTKQTYIHVHIPAKNKLQHLETLKYYAHSFKLLSAWIYLLNTAFIKLKNTSLPGSWTVYIPYNVDSVYRKHVKMEKFSFILEKM